MLIAREFPPKDLILRSLAIAKRLEGWAANSEHGRIVPDYPPPLISCIAQAAMRKEFCRETGSWIWPLIMTSSGW